jgi:hypothetical protein
MARISSSVMRRAGEAADLDLVVTSLTFAADGSVLSATGADALADRGFFGASVSLTAAAGARPADSSTMEGAAFDAARVFRAGADVFAAFLGRPRSLWVRAEPGLSPRLDFFSLAFMSSSL